MNYLHCEKYTKEKKLIHICHMSLSNFSHIIEISQYFQQMSKYENHYFRLFSAKLISSIAKICIPVLSQNVSNNYLTSNNVIHRKLWNSKSEEFISNSVLMAFQISFQFFFNNFLWMAVITEK